MASNLQKFVNFPPPVGGWNARDDLSGFELNEAVQLININPLEETAELRKGVDEHCASLSGSAVESLFEYISASGTRKMLAGSGDYIWDVTSSIASNISGVASFNSNRWQGTNYKNKLYLVNGEDSPLETQGTSLLATAWAGTALSNSNLINASVYKERLYFVEKNTTAYWYSDPAVSTLNLYLEDIGQFITRGGSLIYAGSWTRGTADTTEDLFVAVTNQGEILVYSGRDPTDAYWSLTGHFFIGRTLGHRAAVNVGSDLLIMAEDGIYPLSQLIQNVGSTAYTSVTDKIAPAYRSAAVSHYSNLGWQALNYPNRAMLIINIPTVSGSKADQYVMNTKTGAWCKWTGINALCWTIYNGKPYFGTSDGKVYQADTTQTDEGANIPATWQTAFSGFKDASLKQWCMAQPLLVADSQIEFLFDVAVDYQPKQLSGVVTTSEAEGAEWDVAEWDVADWAGSEVRVQDWNQLSELGYTGSIIMRGNFGNVTFKISGCNVIYKQGGVR